MAELVQEDVCRLQRHQGDTLSPECSMGMGVMSLGGSVGFGGV